MRQGVQGRGKRLIPIARPALGEEEFRAVREVLESGTLVQGPKVDAFERAFASFVSSRHAVATSSGSAALHVALMSLDLGPGDEVVMPAATFMACASMTLAAGGMPTFGDVEEGTYTLDPVAVQAVGGPKTRVVMPVHLYGQPADMGAILRISKERDWAVVEDACQAHGARYGDRPVGSLGRLGCFSFYPTKNMTTMEGGMVVTDDEELAQRCRLLRDHGQVRKYHHTSLGYNYRMTEVAAAIGLVQLKRLPGFLQARRRNARALDGMISGRKGLVPPVVGKERDHSYYQYVVRVSGHPWGRDKMVEYLNEKGVGARPSYPMPLYQQEFLSKKGITGRCPRTEAYLPNLLELPVHPLVGREDLEYMEKVIEGIP